MSDPRYRRGASVVSIHFLRSDAVHGTRLLTESRVVTAERLRHPSTLSVEMIDHGVAQSDQSAQ